jgi:hypothetical protein
VFDIVDDYDYQDIEGGTEVGNGVKVVLADDEEVSLGMVKKKFNREQSRESIVYPYFKFRGDYNELFRKLNEYEISVPPGASRTLKKTFYLRRAGKDTELNKLSMRGKESIEEGGYYTFSMNDQFVIKATWDGDEHF